jgi:hypothetical protein
VGFIAHGVVALSLFNQFFGLFYQAINFIGVGNRNDIICLTMKDKDVANVREPVADVESAFSGV